jgi:SNF2 family DNA or RNA helicase
MKPLTSATAELFKPIYFKSTTRLHLDIDDEGKHFTASFFIPDPSGWRDPHDIGVKTLTGRIPERKELSGAGCSQWQLGATDFTVELILAHFPLSQAEMTPEAQATFSYIHANSLAQDKAAEVYANWKEHQIVPQHSYDMSSEMPLECYQQVALYNAMRSTGYGLFMQQGTGKTPVAIARICNEAKGFRAKHKRVHRTIVVAPKNVRMNWYDEMARFATGSGVTTVLRGGELRQVKQLLEGIAAAKGLDYHVIIISYETLSRRWNRLSCLEYDLAILDEGHYIKWPETERAKTAMKLRDISKRRMILTGTPITNTPLDLYAQLEFLEQGGSGFVSWKAFRTFYGVYDKDASGRDKLISVQNMPFMQERLARVSFIISKKEALPFLPEKTYDVMEVEMTPHQKSIYEDLRDKLAHEIEDDLADESRPQSIVINCVLTKMLRLAQITSGILKWDAVFDDEGNVTAPGLVEQFDPNPKIDVMVEALLELPKDEKAIIWCCFVPNIKAVSAALTKAGIKHVTYYGATKEDDRTDAVYDFNHDPETRVMIANPEAGGTGLNLLGYPPGRGDEYDTDCTWNIFYSQNWKPTPRWQAEDRNHRRGVRRPVRNTDLCIPGTVDEQIRARVLQKKNNAMTVQDLREILHSVLYGVLEND